jgi:hypothetical protein
MQHRFLTPLIFAILFSGSFARAQQSDAPSVLMSELCGCMSAIDIADNDRAVEASVRNCLEDAVVMHPVEVRAILQHRPSAGSKAFQLGTALGGALQQMCQPFNLVRARLQRIPPSGMPTAAVKQGT